MNTIANILRQRVQNSTIGIQHDELLRDMEGESKHQGREAIWALYVAGVFGIRNDGLVYIAI